MPERNPSHMSRRQLIFRTWWRAVFSGILTGLLMLHLTFVGADLTCAQHGDRPAGSHEHPLAHHEHHVAAAHAETVAAADQPCETPTQPECCHAMTSCAISAAFADGARASSVPPVRQAIRGVRWCACPLSQITSPDPPPPKA